MTVNFPIQGTAADILKRAMLSVHATLIETQGGARMILTVHDELLIESPEAVSHRSRRITFAKPWKARQALAVPLTVDVGIGPNWRDAKP